MKHYPILAGLSLLLSAASGKAHPLLDLSFKSDIDAGKFEALVDGVSLGRIGGNSVGLILDKTVAEQPLKPVPVTALKKYKLSLRAAIAGSDTIEVNDRLPEIVAANGGRSFARCELEFFDKDGNETTFLLYGRAKLKTDAIHIVSGKLEDYVTVFYAPPNAETVRLKLVTKNRKVLVESLILELETSEGTVNCNPDLRYGPLNLSGWRPDVEGRLFRRPDGSPVLKCGLRGRSSMFAVSDQARYSFLCKGAGYSSTDGKVTVSFYDIDGNELGYTHLFWDKDMKKGSTKLGIQPLPGSRIAIVKASRIILEKVMVTKD